jgi:hypothetical protein
MERSNVSRSYTTNGLNQYTQAGAVGFGYDARGNLTSSGANAYTYSKLNELKTAPGIVMTYDPLGRMIDYNPGASTRFVYDGGSPVAEYNSLGTILRRYVPGPGVDEPIVWYEGSSVGSTARRYPHARTSVARQHAGFNINRITPFDQLDTPSGNAILNGFEVSITKVVRT